METITKGKFIQIFRKKSISLFNWQDVFKIFDIKPATAKALLRRLKLGRVIQPLSRGKYLFLLASRLPEEFEIANFLYSPSYISLESGLSFYGIIDQFPYKVFSVTLGKSKSFEVSKKVFVYTHIKKELFRDYKKDGNFLIATPEKSIFDFLYLIYKGGRTKNNLNLLHPERVGFNNEKLNNYFTKVTRGQDKKFIKFCQNQKII